MHFSVYVFTSDTSSLGQDPVAGVSRGHQELESQATGITYEDSLFWKQERTTLHLEHNGYSTEL